LSVTAWSVCSYPSGKLEEFTGCLGNVRNGAGGNGNRGEKIGIKKVAAERTKGKKNEGKFVIKGGGGGGGKGGMPGKGIQFLISRTHSPKPLRYRAHA